MPVAGDAGVVERGSPFRIHSVAQETCLQASCNANQVGGYLQVELAGWGCTGTHGRRA